MRLKLASRSEARQAMLIAAGVPFEMVDSAVDEEAVKAGLRGDGLGALELAAALAEAKALGVETSDFVLGADQTIEREDGAMLDKPTSRAEAFAQLKGLAGSSHQLHSAAAIAENCEIVWQHAETVTLTMRPLSDAFLETYLDQEYEAIRWGVGGYRIEGRGVQLFERIEGSHFAILGLPLLPLLGFLRQREMMPS